MTVATWRPWPAALAPFVLLLCLAVPAAAAAQAPQGQSPVSQPQIPWWRSPQFQKDLGMSADQVARVDAIFQATLPDLRAKRDDLDRYETKLSNLIEADADEASVARWVDKTEAARGGLNKVRTLMLMRMRQVLTPDQRVRFKVLHEQWDRNRKQEQARRQAAPAPAPTPGKQG